LNYKEQKTIQQTNRWLSDDTEKFVHISLKLQAQLQFAAWKNDG
jgi:hypothetical protein